MTHVQAIQELVEAGLGEAVADESFDRFARLVRRHLGVRTALVSLILDEEQVFPGAFGLPDDVQRARRTPISQAFCGVVVDAGRALVIEDARLDERLAHSSAISGLDIVAYAGFPIFDQRGRAVGSLCAIDPEPRAWSDADLATLADLASACTSELRLRMARERARRMQHVALQATRRSRLLLMLSEAFADAASVQEIVETIVKVGSTGTGARYAGLALATAGGRAFSYTTLDHLEPGLDRSFRRFTLDDPRPSAKVARTGEPLVYRSGIDLVAEFPSITEEIDPSIGARAFLPVVSGVTMLGVIALAWETERDFDQETMAVHAALASYTAHALERVRLLEERREVAKTLQAAMLSALPEVRHLEIASTYSPATRTDQVGGDWYDAVVLDEDASVLMIGDVTGHDMHAAAQMGQLRSMLRTFAWSQDESPATLLRLLDKANYGLGLDASGTAVVARLEHRSQAPGGVPDGAVGPTYDLTWANAGHLPPLVLRADGTVETLQGGADLMLGFVPGTPRHDHHASLRPGDTLLLYTDGLVERRGTSLGGRIDRLVAALGEHRGATGALPGSLVSRLVGKEQRDDVAVLAVRVRYGIGTAMPTARRPVRVSRAVEHSSAAIAPARRWTDDILESVDVPRDQRRTAMLLTSEILTNAFEHAEPPLEITVEVDHEKVRVGVQDHSEDEPMVKYPQPHEPGGRGVQFLERYAVRWWVERHRRPSRARRQARHHEEQGPVKTVWFELERFGPSR